jgi:hypothetical protein
LLWGGHPTSPVLSLAVIAQGLDQLVFGHRGAPLDAGLSGLLAQLLDGLLPEVLPALDLPRLSLASLGLAGSAPRLGGLDVAPLGSAARSAVPGPRPPARPTLAPAAFLRLRAVRTRSAGSPMPGTARITAASRPRRVSLLSRRLARAGRLRVVVTLWPTSWRTPATLRSRRLRSRPGVSLPVAFACLGAFPPRRLVGHVCA